MAASRMRTGISVQHHGRLPTAEFHFPYSVMAASRMRTRNSSSACKAPSLFPDQSLFLRLGPPEPPPPPALRPQTPPRAPLAARSRPGTGGCSTALCPQWGQHFSSEPATRDSQDGGPWGPGRREAYYADARRPPPKTRTLAVLLTPQPLCTAPEPPRKIPSGGAGVGDNSGSVEKTDTGPRMPTSSFSRHLEKVKRARDKPLPRWRPRAAGCSTALCPQGGSTAARHRRGPPLASGPRAGPAAEKNGRDALRNLPCSKCPKTSRAEKNASKKTPASNPTGTKSKNLLF
ncbi:uncharacterized protein [Taeniopygia guttata]|uniref:uncharacterized protein n=1 Tax=Taeniopygia guttata TaxID=59729 RepID=UPI003BB96140